MAVAAIATGAAGNVIANVIGPLIQQIDDVIHMDENRGLLQAQLNRMKGLLCDIGYQFQDQRKIPPQSLRNCLGRMEDEVKKARELVDGSQHPHSCVGIDWAFLWKPILSRKIKKCNTSFHGLFDELHTDFSVFCSAQQIASFRPEEAEMKIERLLTAEAHHVRRIGVYGTGGVGKTSLLQKIYNNQKVSDAFNAVIWVTVAQFSILELQERIASQVNLDLSETDPQLRKKKLCKCLKAKIFFMVLEDMWAPLDLQELGVEFHNDRANKVIFSTCNKNLIEEMKPEECMEIEAMSKEEAWDLFSKVAFKEAGGHVAGEIEEIAKQVCSECKGLPLALNVIASSLIGKSDVREWDVALKQMKRLHFNLPIPDHPQIDRDLFQRLRLSYDCLPDRNLKICFLYCAMFPQQTAFRVKTLVQMLTAEGLLDTKDTGNSYVKLLEYRYLFQVEPQENVITVHDAVRDVATYIGETEEKCVFRAGQLFQQFPRTETECKRISVMGNKIRSLPANELRCPRLVTLFLGKLELKEIPEAFLRGLISLKVLDISGTPLESLPLSLWQLRQLEFLNLSGTEIENLDEGIGNLSSLQFLNLSNCVKLKSLPFQIGKLKSLKYFDFTNCETLKVVPKKITDMVSYCEIVQ